MSKKKNTLKDLDEFLKQQAATLVSPEKLSSAVDTPQPPSATAPEPEEVISFEKVTQDLETLSAKEGQQFRSKFYEMIIKTLEHRTDAEPSDVMLINTALYLKHGDNWKEAIRDYWKKRG